MTRPARVTAFTILIAIVTVATARAQGTAPPASGAWELTGGATWSGGFDLGSRSADETRNAGTGSGGFSLFQTRSEAASVTGASVKLGFYVSRAIAIEAGGYYFKPEISTHVNGDAEDAAPATITETMTRVIVDGSLVFHLNGLSFGSGRAVPFVFGGAGYLRELHEGNEFIETGTEYHAGAGLKYWLGQGTQRLGVRVDIAASIRDGGFDFSEKPRTLPTAGFAVTYLF